MKVTVIDYGSGNLYSVQRALEFCGARNIVISSQESDINDADRLILPGVGAFENGMNGLRSRGLIEPIIRYANQGKPLLGICLGMQMLASSSNEFGVHEGLNLIPGQVVPIPAEGKNGVTHKIPFIGWTSLDAGNEVNYKNSVLSDATQKDAVYMVHSYYMLPENEGSALATYDYDGISITAAVQSRNIIGLQFHPEKSGKVGLSILKKFIS